MTNSSKVAIILMGPSGIGKGTQAFRLIQRFPNLIHFDTGQEIKKRVDDSAFSTDPKVSEQREVYYRGDLNDTVWVAELVCERIRSYAENGKGVVLSGSPRKLYEAQQVGPLLQELFDPRVLLIKLNAADETVKTRMRSRLVCNNASCGFPATKELAALPCPQCGEGWLTPKTLDSKEGIQKRIQWFYKETIPAISHLYLLGIPSVDVDGEGREEEVFGRILAAIKEKLIVIGSN